MPRAVPFSGKKKRQQMQKKREEKKIIQEKFHNDKAEYLKSVQSEVKELSKFVQNNTTRNKSEAAVVRGDLRTKFEKESREVIEARKARARLPAVYDPLKRISSADYYAQDR